MAKTPSGKTPEQIQREQEIIIQRATQKFERRFSREIARAMREMLKASTEGTSIDLDQALKEHERRLERLLVALYMDSIEASIRVLEPTAKSRVMTIERKEDAPTWTTPNADAIMREWLLTYGGLKITRITQTTLDDVRTIINYGITNGLSEVEIGEYIASIIPTKSASRAQTIARTESHQAANVAAVNVAKNAGLVMGKRWSASRGERTRPAHREADGQTVPMDGVFIVDGEELRYPGDPLGKAENVINCRCMVVYVI